MMKEEDMRSSLENFANLLRQVQETLSSKKKDVSNAGKEIFSILDSTAATLALNKKPSSAFEQKIQDIFDDFGKGIQKWKNEREAALALKERVNSLGEGLVVMAFGRTNAGKSTLGNFLRGKQLREDKTFKNAWKEKDFEPSPIMIIEKDNNTKLTEASEEEKWLKEGASETTREIQSFKLPGFLWVDTPGFGSLNDGTLGELARKYVETADLIIYLDDSDNPGLKDQTTNLINLLKKGRENILIAINKSDKLATKKGPNGKCIIENGKICQQLVAKSKNDRDQQEKYLISLLKDQFKKDMTIKKDIKAMSFSMKLAIKAVEQDNNKLYTESNMEKFFAMIKNIVPNNKAILDFKYNQAIKDCTHMIEQIMGKTDSHSQKSSLKILDVKLEEMENNIKRKNQEFDINQLTGEMTGTIMAQVRPQTNSFIQDNMGSNSSADNFPIDPNIFLGKVRKDAIKMLERKSEEIFKDLFFSDALDIGKSFPTIESIQLKSQREKQTYTVPGIKYEPRDPSGVWEYIKSFFGAKYKRAVRTEETREIVIDHGFNVEETVAELNNTIEGCLSQFIRDNLESTRNECIDNGLKYIAHARSELRKAQDDLERQKSRLQNLIN